jgi:hypothetical protein
MFVGDWKSGGEAGDMKGRVTWSAGEKSKEPAIRKGLWVNPYGIHGTGPALRKADPGYDR